MVKKKGRMGLKNQSGKKVKRIILVWMGGVIRT